MKKILDKLERLIDPPIACIRIRKVGENKWRYLKYNKKYRNFAVRSTIEYAPHTKRYMIAFDFPYTDESALDMLKNEVDFAKEAIKILEEKYGRP